MAHRTSIQTARYNNKNSENSDLLGLPAWMVYRNDIREDRLFETIKISFSIVPATMLCHVSFRNDSYQPSEHGRQVFPIQPIFPPQTTIVRLCIHQPTHAHNR
mmetsp:Transcript_20867/g.42944  ORF Transcript_20867/g.42944 Transcript_20867/m.42944 type:complete len:103 (+) Transcript_20867:84-392(+)